MARVYNFSAGPSMLPEKVLKQAQAELLEYGDSGQSVRAVSACKIRSRTRPYPWTPPTLMVRCSSGNSGSASSRTAQHRTSSFWCSTARGRL